MTHFCMDMARHFPHISKVGSKGGMYDSRMMNLTSIMTPSLKNGICTTDSPIAFTRPPIHFPRLLDGLIDLTSTKVRQLASYWGMPITDDLLAPVSIFRPLKVVFSTMFAEVVTLPGSTLRASTFNA